MKLYIARCMKFYGTLFEKINKKARIPMPHCQSFTTDSIMRGRIVCDRLSVRGGPKMAVLSGQPFFLTIEKSRFAPSGTTQEH